MIYTSSHHITPAFFVAKIESELDVIYQIGNTPGHQVVFVFKKFRD
jgi:hypothetical protein